MHFEFNYERQMAMEMIQKFVKGLGNFGPFTWLVLKDHHKREQLECNLQHIEKWKQLDWQPFSVNANETEGGE